MSDISMCQDKNCPVRGSCWRQSAPKGSYQSYASFQWMRDGCEYYWPIDGRVTDLMEIEPLVTKEMLDDAEKWHEELAYAYLLIGNALRGLK